MGWRPSLFRIAPLVGLAALLFAVLQIAASFAVLKASDGDAVVNWGYQPTVYLAILTAVSNKALSFAVIQGTVCHHNRHSNLREPRITSRLQTNLA